MDSTKGRLAYCMSSEEEDGWGNLKRLQKNHLGVSLELRGGFCQVTKANSGRGNCTGKGWQLSLGRILYGTRWEVRPERSLERETGLWQTVGCMGVLEGGNTG